jgi:hypothetical protein
LEDSGFASRIKYLLLNASSPTINSFPVTAYNYNDHIFYNAL